MSLPVCLCTVSQVRSAVTLTSLINALTVVVFFNSLLGVVAIFYYLSGVGLVFRDLCPATMCRLK